MNNYKRYCRDEIITSCKKKISDKKFNKYKYNIKKDSPDEFGLPTDEDLENEYKAKIAAIKKQREEAIAKKEAKIREEKELESKYSKDLEIIKNSNTMEDLYELVPDSGKADTLAGELVRAFMRVEYRWYNDGDVFFEGYGYTNTCSAPMAFIAKNTDLENDIWEFAEGVKDYGEPFDYDDIDYDYFLNELKTNLYDEIKSNPKKFMKPTKDMYDIDGKLYFENAVPKYDFNIEIPYDISEKEFTYRDFEDFFDSNVLWDIRYDDITINYRKDNATITDIDRYDYEKLDDYNWDEIWDEFRNEYLNSEKEEEE